VAAALAATRDGLEAGTVQVVHAQMARYLNRAPQAFDVVFLDPPFAQPRLAEDACRRLVDGGWLAPGARVYLEVAAHVQRPMVPADWTLVREKASGDAHALLYATPA
jgi:16S rRNA (guanine966-N2)-methyltransferase